MHHFIANIFLAALVAIVFIGSSLYLFQHLDNPPTSLGYLYAIGLYFPPVLLHLALRCPRCGIMFSLKSRRILIPDTCPYCKVRLIITEKIIEPRARRAIFATFAASQYRQGLEFAQRFSLT
jgi:hypothetical protein